MKQNSTDNLHSDTSDQPEPALALRAHIAERMAAAGGWIPFDEFMALALYTPSWGYYSRGRDIFGLGLEPGSDFVTAPELSPFFGRALAVQVREAMSAYGVDTVLEFGAGSGALAEQLLDILGQDSDVADSVMPSYTIIELSAALRVRQQQRLARFGARVRWLDAWPSAINAVVIANEVLDAMPVKLLHRQAGRWHERGVVHVGGHVFEFADFDSPLANSALAALADHDLPDGAVTEIHPQAEAFIIGLAERLQCGMAILIDYGFPEREYYHPQRTGGTLMCHQAHRVDGDPLADVGAKDITAHVNWSRIALSAQDAGLAVLGYTSQARFLLNCGLVDLLSAATLGERAHALKLINEHEMGELFKVMLLARGGELDDPIGLRTGDRSHRL